MEVLTTFLWEKIKFNLNWSGDPNKQRSPYRVADFLIKTMSRTRILTTQ